MIARMSLAGALVLSLSAVALGQIWDGGGANNNWTTGLNWSGDTAPVNNGTATVRFAGVNRLAPTVDVSYDVSGVIFDSTAGAFNIQSIGSAILSVRGNGVTNNNPGTTETISVATSIAASQTWTGTGPITAAGPVGLSANTLTIDSPATITFSNVVVDTGSIVKNGTGAVVFTGSNTFSGGITLNNGTLAVGLNAGLGTGTLRINGGKFEGTGGARTLANVVVINGDFAIPSGTAVTFSGPVTLTGQHKLTNSITNLAISGAIGENAASSELELAGGGTLTLSGAALTLGTSLKLSAGTFAATGLVVNPGHTFTQSGGTFTGSVINRGVFVYNGGTHSGNLANEASGDATINGNLTLTAALANAGTLRVTNARTLNFAAQQLNNTGTIELSGGTLSANASTLFTSSGLVSGYGTISTTGTAFANSGQIQVSGGNLTLTSNVAFSNSGTISVPSGRQLQWNGTANYGNTGLVQLAGGGLAGTGTFANSGGGEIRGSGTVQLPLANSGGLVRATGPDPLTITNLAGNNTGGGELRVDDGATLNIQSAFSSNGTIVLEGASTALNLNSVTNSGTLRGRGRVTGAVLNSGVVRAEEGTLTFTSAGNTNTAAGRLEAGTASQLLYSQGLATNAGLIALAGGTVDNSTAALANSGRIEGYGTLRTGGLTNTGTLSVGGTLDVLGAVTNNGVVSAAAGSTIRFFGPVNGPGSYTGTGTVTFLNTFSPGASPAAVSFGGDVSLESATSLAIELGGTAAGSQYDTVAAAGSVALGGVLDVSLLAGFMPTPGDEFQIVSSTGGVNGKFTSATLPSLTGANWQLRYQSNAVFLRVAIQGDYNFDGHVDAADYSLWRDSLGQVGAGLAADGNGDGRIDAGDLGVWNSNFGQSIAGGAASLAAVPEPASLALLWLMLLRVHPIRCRRR